MEVSEEELAGVAGAGSPDSSPPLTPGGLVPFWYFPIKYQ